MTDGIRCMLLRGGSSKGAYFLAEDLPPDPDQRDELLLRIMGSPDERQIDGIGGGHPLTSKVAVVSPSTSPDADVDYLFLQVAPNSPAVSQAQTCGNLLAGVGPFALERSLLPTEDDATTTVRIRMLNPTEAFAAARVQTPAGKVRYEGSTAMAGTPFPAAPVELSFPGNNMPVFPTGRILDVVEGFEVTCVDAGMPVIVIRAADLGLRGDEPPELLESDARVREVVESIRRQAGSLMGLGPVASKTVPKVSLVSAPGRGGTLTTRTFIPHRVHAAIGVLGGVSVAAAALTPGTVAQPFTPESPSHQDQRVRIEHPTGIFDVHLELDPNGPATRLRRSSVVRTARKLFDGFVWPREANS